MPESTRKRSAAKVAAEPAPEPVPAKKAGPAAKPAKSATVETPVVEEPVAEEDAGTAEADEFLNRAARRAKGRGRSGGAQPATGRGSSFSGRGSVPGQRQWGNRRTGG